MNSKYNLLILQVARKDIVRMNALSATRAAIKLKNQVKTNSIPTNSSENGGTNRSHKLGVVPKSVTIQKKSIMFFKKKYKTS